MFNLPTGTKIKVYAPFNKVNGSRHVVNGENCYTDTSPWKDHITKNDTILEKHEVYDIVALLNDRSDVADWPMWIKDNVRNGNTVFVRDGVYGMVKGRLEYLD